MIYQYGNRIPELHGDEVFVAESADVIGSVVLEENSSVWFGAVLRGDCDLITVGARSNIQDSAVLHTDPGFQLTIGEDVTVGHCAMLHGCTVGDGSLIGIGAVDFAIGLPCISRALFQRCGSGHGLRWRLAGSLGLPCQTTCPAIGRSKVPKVSPVWFCWIRNEVDLSCGSCFSGSDSA